MTASTDDMAERLARALEGLVAVGCPNCLDDACHEHTRKDCPLAKPREALAAYRASRPINGGK